MRSRLVALTSTCSPDRQRLPTVRVHDAYVQALQSAGLVPLIVPPSLSADEARDVIAGVAGVLLSGGEDVGPSTYGAAPHPLTQPSHAGRDATEIALALAARDVQRPVLAICRGLQLLNVALGGTLVQDLPSQQPSHIAHAQYDARTQRVHGVAITEDGRLSAAVGCREWTVNTLHHQAIDAVAPLLRVTARASDGVIEAAETSDAWWVLGVQWHPEELIADPQPWDRAIFAGFAAACRA